MIRKTQKLWLLGLLLILSGMGCISTNIAMLAYPHANKINFSQEKDDHRQAIKRIIDHDRRALIEDLDYFYMTDRQSRLTRWHTR